MLCLDYTGCMKTAAPLPEYSTDEGDDAPWRKLVWQVLKGAPFETLVSRTADGLAIKPLYRPAAGEVARAIRSQPGRWSVSQRVEHPDPATASLLALDDLEGGADALTLVFKGAPGDYGFGLAGHGVDQLDMALSGVDLDLIRIRLDSAGDGSGQAQLFSGLTKRRRLVASRLRVDFGCDPVGACFISGAFDETGDASARLLKPLTDQGFAGRFFMCGSRPVHAAGGTQAQELAHVLASGVHYLRLLAKHGFSLDDARRQISFLLAADAGQFLTIAKFRAVRQLWARVEEACGLEPEPIRLHAETAWRMLTRRDPFVNVLRTTMAVFSAGIGGADCITALPHTTALGLPDGLARRIARNAQMLLLEEAHLGDVDDPMAGTGGIEALTQGLCEKAWELFQAIDKAGGIVSALAQGAPQRGIAAAAAARAKDIATRKLRLTGISEYADLGELPASVLMRAPFRRLLPAKSAQDSQHESPPALLDIPPSRDAEPFERLRDRADAYTVRHGGPPNVFLANLGLPAGSAARASFAANAFAAGGIAAAGNGCFAGADGETDIAALASAARQSGARLVCLCGSDAAYANQALPAAKALSGHFSRIFLAGRPGAEFDHHFQVLFAGCDLVAALQLAFASLDGKQS